MRSIQPELYQGVAYVVQLLEFMKLDEAVTVNAMNAEKALIQVIQTKFDPQKQIRVYSEFKIQMFCAKCHQ